MQHAYYKECPKYRGDKRKKTKEGDERNPEMNSKLKKKYYSINREYNERKKYGYAKGTWREKRNLSSPYPRTYASGQKTSQQAHNLEENLQKQRRIIKPNNQ